MDCQRWKVVGGREKGREDEPVVLRGEEAGECMLEDMLEEEKEGGREGGARARASAQM